MLAIPRTLKQALRHTWLAWQELHGEADLNDLFVCTTIRAASGRAFDWLMANYRLLGNREQGRDKECKTGWDLHVTDCGHEARERLWRMVRFVFPSHMNLSGRFGVPPQGARYPRYWDRIVSQWMTPGVRDQTVLRDMRDWRTDPATGELADKLSAGSAEAETYALIVEDFLRGTIRGELQLAAEEKSRLASRVFQSVLQREGCEACSDSCVGFIPLWRVATRKDRGERYASWLWGEIEEALPVSLKFANELDYFWGSVKQQLLREDENAELRLRMIQWAKNHWDADMLCASLPRQHDWVLHHFVRHQYAGREDNFDAGQWRWLPRRLIAVLERCPDVAVKQVCQLLCEQRDQVDRDDHARPVSIRMHELNKSLVRSIARTKRERRNLMEALVSARKATAESSPENEKIIQAVVAEASDWLKAGLP